ncbi:hypothetical protein ACP275_10G171700 [Erythranthe tilingii]
MQKLLHSPIFRSVRNHFFTPSSTFTSFPDNALENSNIASEVLAVINSVNPIQPALAELAPFLNREVVISVLRSQSQLKKDPRICFRFYIWAAERAHLRSGASHNLIVDMLLSGGGVGDSFDLYWGVLDELRDEKLRVDAHSFAVLISGYWKLRKAEMAVEAFGRMKDYECKPNIAVYNLILNVLVKSDTILLALAVYNMILKSNCGMGADTFNVLIDGLFKSEMIEDALNLYDEMTQRRILPTKITYTVVISGMCKAKRTHDAHRMFELMKTRGCRPDSATYNALLDGFCKCGQIDEAFKLFKSFRADGYNVGIRGFGCLIDGLIKAKRISGAEKLFQQVLDAGLVPDIILYTIMMRGLTELGRMEDATNMLRDMIGKGVMPDTRCYNVLIKGFCDLGLLDEARSLELEISQHNQFPNSCTYTILICGLCRNGLLGEAQEIFNGMEKLNCSPSVVTFNALIDGLCKAAKVDEARLMLHKMEIGKNPSLFLRLSQGTDRVLDSASLHKKVETLVESGLIHKAYKLLIQLADSGVVPNIKTYNTLINGMCKDGQVDRALKVFEELKHKGHFPDSVTYATLIEGLQRVDREGDAYKLFKHMNENGCKPSASVYKTLMTWSCRRRKTSVAFGLWLEYLRSLAGREGEALKSTEKYFEKGDFEMAVRSLLEMDMKLVDFDSGPYNIWLVGLCQTNRVDVAIRTFSVLEEFNVVVSAPGCVKLIEALCSEGNLGKAVDVFLYTIERGYKLMPRVCNGLLQRLLGSKERAAVAFELLDKMKSVGYDLNSCVHHNTRFLIRHRYSERISENVLSAAR